MVKRTTVEIDVELLEEAKSRLGCETARATIDTALRRAVASEEAEFRARRELQMEYLKRLPELVDMDVLASDEMWR